MINTFIGCSGWNYPEWKMNFYKGVTQKNMFKRYAEVFGTCEINNTFYKFPSTDIIRKWYNESPDGFIFTIKATRIFTHFKTRLESEKLNEFYTSISNLNEKLGCVLFQFPGTFKYDKKALVSIIENLDYNFRNVVEFRNLSWWNKTVYDAFKQNGVIFCNVSSPLELPEGTVHHTAEDLFIRFHGITDWYDHDYTEQELQVWVDSVRRVRPKRVWAYFNNTNRGDAVYNALEFQHMLIDSE
jgi:uncharacterized protein YecE (DUF72 family)